MIGMRTILRVADNSGARKLACILPVGGDVGLQAGLGDVVTASVNTASSRRPIPGSMADDPITDSPVHCNAPMPRCPDVPIVR